MMVSRPTLEDLDNTLSQIPYAWPKKIIEPEHHNKVKEFLELWMRYNCIDVLEPEIYESIKDIPERKAKDFIVTEDWNSILNLMKKIATLLHTYSDILGIDGNEEKKQARDAYETLLNKLQEVSDNTTISSQQYRYRLEALKCLRKLVIERPTWWIKIEDIQLNRRQIMKLTYDGEILLTVLDTYDCDFHLGTIISTPIRYFTVSKTEPFRGSPALLRWFEKDLTYHPRTLGFYFAPFEDYDIVEWWAGYENPKTNIYVIPMQGAFTRFDDNGALAHFFKFSTESGHFELVAIAKYAPERLTCFCMVEMLGYEYYKRIFVFRTNSVGNVIDYDEQGNPHGWMLIMPFRIDSDKITWCARALDSDHIVFALTDRDGRPVLMLTRSNGEPIWALRATNLSGCITHTICKIDDNTALVVWGNVIYDQIGRPQSDRIYIVLVTKSGVQQVLCTDWKIVQIKKDSDGNLLLLGRKGVYSPIATQEGALIKMSPDGAIHWAFTLKVAEGPTTAAVPEFYDVAEDGEYYLFSTGWDVHLLAHSNWGLVPLIMKVNKQLLAELYEYPDENFEPLEIQHLNFKWVFYLIPRTISFTQYDISWESFTPEFLMLPDRIYMGALRYYSYELDENFSKTPPPIPYIEEITYSEPITLDYIGLRGFASGGIYPAYHAFCILGRVIEDSDGKTSLLFIKADLDTNIIFSKKISGPGSLIPKDVITLPPGGIAILCEITEFGASDAAALVIILDNDGNFEKAYGLSFGRYSTIPASILWDDGKLVLFGGTNAVKYPYWTAFITTIELNSNDPPGSIFNNSQPTVVECFPHTIDATIYSCGYGLKIAKARTLTNFHAIIRITPKEFHPGYFCANASYAACARMVVPVEPERWITDERTDSRYFTFVPAANYNSTLLYIENPCTGYGSTYHIYYDYPLIFRTISRMDTTKFMMLGYLETPDKAKKMVVAFLSLYNYFSLELAKYIAIPGRDPIFTSSVKIDTKIYHVGYDPKTGAGLMAYIRDKHLPTRKGSIDILPMSFTMRTHLLQQLALTQETTKIIIEEVPAT